MPGAVVFGLFAAGIVLAGTAVVYLVDRAGPGAAQLAREVDLALPEQLAGLAQDRWNRRSVALAVARAAVPAPVCGVAAWFVAVRFDSGGRIGGLQSPMPGPALLIAVAGAVLLARVLGCGWELAHRRREVAACGAHAEPTARVRLRDALPGSFLWNQRVAAVLPVLLAVALQVLLRRAGQARGLDGLWAWHAGLLVAGAAGAWAVERSQLAVLNGRCTAGSWQELALDDALRVRQAVAMAPLLLDAVYVAESFVLRPVFAAVPATAAHDLRWIGDAWVVPVILALGMRARSYLQRTHGFYRRRASEGAAGA